MLNAFDSLPCESSLEIFAPARPHPLYVKSYFCVSVACWISSILGEIFKLIKCTKNSDRVLVVRYSRNPNLISILICP